jgi:probable HAF family extracellular repeat protein
LAIALASASSATADPLYTITDLGAGDSGAINNAGQVAFGGVRDTSLYSSYGSNAGSVVPLGSFATTGINSSGQVVGNDYNATPTQGVEATAGSSPIPLAGSANVEFQAHGINDLGQIVGTDYTNWRTSYEPQAVLDDGGKTTYLGTLGGPMSQANAINDAGQIVGTASLANGSSHAFVGTAGHLTDLGTLPGGNQSEALAINAAGQIVGSSATTSDGFSPHAFLFSNGVMHDLGTLPGYQYSYAAGINNAGVVVGTSAVVDVIGAQRGFIVQNGIMEDLNQLLPANSGWRIQSAIGINDAGQILVAGVPASTPYAESDILVLTPAGLPRPAPIPEPSAFAVFGLAAGAFWLRFRRGSTPVR